MEGSGQGAPLSLSVGALLGEPRVGVSSLGIQQNMGRRVQGTDIILRGAPLGNLAGA